MTGAVRQLREQSAKDLTLLGSGSILTQLTDAGLIDDYAVMIDPVALGRGTPLFGGLAHKLDLELTGSRTFGSGVVLLNYRSLKGRWLPGRIPAVGSATSVVEELQLPTLPYPNHPGNQCFCVQ